MDISKVNMPMPMPKVEIPKVNIPKVDIPKVEIPKVNMPNMPKVNIPNMPKATMPKVNIPKATMQNVNIPKATMPNMPKVTIPNMQNVNIPKVTIPKATMPKFAMPQLPASPINPNTIKVLIVSISNVLAKPEGRALLKQSLKMLDPAIKMLTDEMVINIRKNNPKLVTVLREFGTPVASAARDTMGMVPGFGEALSVYLAAKNVSLSMSSGANMFSSIVDSFLTVPLTKVFKRSLESLENAKKLKKGIDGMSDELKSSLKLINEFDKETTKISAMVNSGVNVNSLMGSNISPITMANKMPLTMANKMPVTMAQPLALANKSPIIKGGSAGKTVIKKTTKRMRQTIKRFYTTS